MTDAIFRTTGQALATAFLIVSTPPKQDCALRQALMRMLESVELPTRMQRDWLDQLRGSRSGSINFDGLSSDEIRAQCAMIVKAVTIHLLPHECAAVTGSYTHNPIEKAQAVRVLSAYIKPTEDSKLRLLFDYCVLRSLPKHGNQHLKPASVLSNMGVTERSTAAYYRETRKRVGELRRIGEDRLQVVFMRDGVINAI